MTQTEFEDLVGELYNSFERIKRFVRKSDSFLYERWKAGGFLVDQDIISNYPNLNQVIDELDVDYDEEECAGKDEE